MIQITEKHSLTDTFLGTLDISFQLFSQQNYKLELLYKEWIWNKVNDLLKITQLVYGRSWSKHSP